MTKKLDQLQLKMSTVGTKCVQNHAQTMRLTSTKKSDQLQLKNEHNWREIIEFKSCFKSGKNDFKISQNVNDKRITAVPISTKKWGQSTSPNTTKTAASNSSVQ